MAEAFAILGALSSIFQILDFSGKVVSLTRTLVKSSNDSVRENIETERLARQYESLASTIESAQQAKNDTDAMQKAQKQVIEAAKQCRDEAKKLLDLLEGLKMSATTKGAARIREGSKKALRSIRQKGEIERRLRNLQGYSGLLTTALVEAQRIKLDECHERVLQELAFDGMQFREQMISEAHPKTCRWALKDDSFNLKPWLTSQDGIFWITGKPGSGKSTLMKFLTMQTDTMKYLRQWSSGSMLVTASFYFWYLGTAPLQKSIEGLLRSILHKLLREVPELSSIVCPEFYDPDKSHKWSPHWTQLDLLSRLRRVVSHGQVSSEKKFCFFIDGLDEYVGNHLDMVDTLTDLSTKSGIKLCLASRPWPTFRRVFEHRWPCLRLEDISKPDILAYVTSHLQTALARGQRLFSPSAPIASLEPLDATALIEEIVDKADGVFLWVFLVTRSVESGFADGDDIPTLRHRVHAFPPDLDDFFRDLLFRRVDPVHIKRVCQLLFLAFIRAKAGHANDSSMQNTIPDSFLDYWLVMRDPEGLNDQEFPFRIDIQELSPDEIHDMGAFTARNLSTWTKELLIMDRQGEPKYTASSQVSFIHRTVFDFLRTSDMQEALLRHTPQYFQTDKLAHLLNLAKLKYLAPHESEYIRKIETVCHFTIADDQYRQLDDRYLTEFEKSILAQHRWLYHLDLGSDAALVLANRKLWI